MFNNKFFKIGIMSLSISSILKFKKFSYKKLCLEETYKLLSLKDFENIQEGEMKQYKYGDKDKESILILKYKGELRALSNYCTHFGAPLHTGVLIDRVVKCPYHGASFDIITGKTDISPSLNGLETFEIIKQDDKYFVKLPNNIKNFKAPEMASRDPKNNDIFVIIGGGPAGLSAAETLRQSGFTGEIKIIAKENYLPYDRASLSKFLPNTVDNLYLRNKDFFSSNEINIITGVEALDINIQDKTISLSNSTKQKFTKVLIATGSSPNQPDIKGYIENSKNIHFLRTFDDANKIKSDVKNKKNIVIVGGNFISMELASFIKKENKDAEVTIVIRGKSPFEKELGDEVGNILKKLHEDNGIKFLLNLEVEEICGNNGLTNKLKLSNGNEINTDMVVFGIGGNPNTKFVKDIVEMDGNHIKSNLFLNTSQENIYSAGDVTSIPFIHSGIRYKYGHYVSAQQQGAIAALNMLNKNVPYDYIPYYWTRMWDKSLQFTGTGSSFDEIFIDGDLSKYEFVAYYFKNGNLVGCSSMGVPNAVNIVYEAFKADILPKANLIKNGSIGINEIKKSLVNVKNKCSRSNCACFSRI